MGVVCEEGGRGAGYRWVKGSRRRRTRMREGSLRDIGASL